MSSDPRYNALTGAVMVRIAKRRLARARAAALFHGALLCGALAALIPAIRYVLASAARTGFSEYLSLIISDGGTLASYWKEFALTIAESAPVMAGALVLGLLLIFGYSARKIAGDMSRMRMRVAAA